MNFLEELIYEYYDWKGFLVKRNIKVGKLLHGGWEMELDIIGYNPKDEILIHIECSTDSDRWDLREARFKKKFDSGKTYILQEIFPWLNSSTQIVQLAILPSRSVDRIHLAGGHLTTIDEFSFLVKNEIINLGKMSKHAIPEQYPLLRMIQLIENGYNKKIQ